MLCTPYTSRHSSRHVCRRVDLIPKREVLAIDYGISLEEAAKGRTARVLEKSGWNQSKAADRFASASAEQLFDGLCAEQFTDMRKMAGTRLGALPVGSGKGRPHLAVYTASPGSACHQGPANRGCIADADLPLAVMRDGRIG